MTHTPRHPSLSGDVPSRSARALWFVGPQEAELRNEQLGPVGDTEIAVRTLTSLVSSGTEMHVYRGRAGSAQAVDLPTTRGTYPFPLKFAYQLVGEVVEAGPQSGYNVGDRVFAMHPHQDHFVMATGGGGAGDIMQGASLVFPVPDDVSAEQASFVNLFSVAYNALLDTPSHIGDVIVVSGLGVIGQFVAHLARSTAGRLIVIDPLAERRERADWLNADAVVHPSDAADVIETLTQGRGCDLWFEASGSPAALQDAIDNTGNEGTITVVSFYGDTPVQLNLGLRFHLGRQRIVSGQVGAVGSGLQPRWDSNRRFATAMEHLATFDVNTLVTHRVPFDEAPSAYQLIDERPNESLAVLLTYGQEA